MSSGTGDQRFVAASRSALIRSIAAWQTAEVWLILAIMQASIFLRRIDCISAGHNAFASTTQAFLPASSTEGAANETDPESRSPKPLTLLAKRFVERGFIVNLLVPIMFADNRRSGPGLPIIGRMRAL